MTALPDRGRLGVLPLPMLLLLLGRAQFSGSLRLSHDAVERAVDLRDGRPVRVRSTGSGLCADLVAAGRLSPEDAARVAAQASKLGGSQEKALLALRLLTPRELYLALREHERAALLECFAWPEGTFELAAGDPGGADATAFAHDPVSLVHAGISAHWGPERTLAVLGGAAHRFATPGPGFEEATASLRALPGFEALRTHLDGQATLADAARAGTHAGAFAAALVLDALGALAYSDVPLECQPEAAPIAPGEQGSEIEIVVAGRTSGGSAGTDAGARVSTAPSGPRSGEADAARRILLEKHGRLAELDHYAILGVPRGGDATALRRAYVAAAKTYHPDAIARLGLDELREVANTVFARITKAHGVLSDPISRRAYDEELAAGGIEDAQRIGSAEIFYRKAEVLLRKGSFDEALQFLRPAVELCEDEATYQSALGWALYKKQASEADAACAALARAVALDPESAVAHFRLGTVLRSIGRASAAATHLARAKTLEPRAATKSG